MMRPLTEVRRCFLLGLAAWIAAIGLLDFASGLLYAQIAKPPAAGKASTPWRFRLEDARIEDIHRTIKSRQITCEKLVQAYIHRIRAYDGMCVAPLNPNDASDPNNFLPMSPSTRELRCNPA